VVGRVAAINGHDILKRVYGVDGCSPTLSTMGGGNTEPKIIASRGRGMNNEQQLEARKDGLTNTITSVAKDNYVAEPAGGLCIRTANKKGYDMAANGDAVDLAYPKSSTRRGRVGHGVSKTIATGDTMGTVQDFRIRKLTPKECWRLMGFDDEDFEKAKNAGISNSQLYKQAGNSIVVNVLEGILKNLIKE
jgi:DNA (cytosine-5)-methyltransferase 1